MTSPTRQEIIDAHDALTSLLKIASRTSTASAIINEKVVRAALPPKPRPTMADVEWDDKEHRLAGAEHRHFGNGVMLCENGDKSIAFIHEDGVEAVRPEHLIPNGKHYHLQETNNG